MAQALKGKGPATVDDLVQKTNVPFNPRVMALPLPTKFKMPHLESFDRTRDPLDHLETFKSLMNLQVVPDKIMCRAFPTTLKGSARVWFNKLKPGSISNFEELSKQFIGHFIAGRRHRKPATYLLNVKQDNGEALCDYIGQFNIEMLQVDEVDDKVALTAFMGGLQSSKFLFSLSKDPPNTMAKLLIEAQKHMNAKDAMNSRKGKGDDDKKGDKKRSAPILKDERDSKFRKFNRSPRVPRGRDNYTNFTPLNAPISQILMQLQDDHTLKWPPKLKSDPTRRSKDKYCRFHRDHGHNTDDCFDLKSQIESLIHRGKLHRYAADREKGTGQPIRKNRENNPPGH
ncbi:uncharacterized protein LOC132313897 [Cornus florida]|uniref:uncharacterized protein LOC132313897 n=1 Tax=Cornus florida TaxID=4283 RepID=UPI0028981561|nr:uncharacterized protein LOC132313897 [Cornus florida]